MFYNSINQAMNLGTGMNFKRVDNEEVDRGRWYRRRGGKITARERGKEL